MRCDDIFYIMSYSSGLPRSVYILGDGLLFDEIIAHMLISDASLRVIRRVFVDDATFLTDVNWCHPDVIVLNETDLFSCKRMLALLHQISLATDLRVIVMSLNNNSIDIFDQPADQMNKWAGVPYTLMETGGWNEIFDLVGGRQLLEGVGR